jgi:hypothetical protein
MQSNKQILSNYIEYRNEYGRYHRTDGPALEHTTGFYKDKQEWFYDGKRHRINGPALISKIAGTEFAHEEYWVDGVRHRVGYYAFISHWEKSWYRSGKLHRLNAPAQFLDNSKQANFSIKSENCDNYYYEFGQRIK